jgi:CRP-like cAMP-binding protein
MSANLKSAFYEPLTLSTATRNKVLKDLLSVPSIANDLLPELRQVTFTVNEVLYEQGDNIQYVYFPLDCVVSNLGIMEDGTTVETAMIGREGVVGMSAILGSGYCRQWVWCCIDGSAVQVEAKLLDRVLVQNEIALRSVLDCYRALITQTSQRCLCNTRHTIHERLCCWLLMVHDRVGGQNLRLTQEMIASRVGARRAGITVAAGLLQGLRAIEYRRGQLHIVDRTALEGLVCECYSVMRTDLPSSEAAS